MNNESEFICGLVGIATVLLCWVVIFGVKLFLECRETKRLLSRANYVVKHTQQRID